MRIVANVLVTAMAVRMVAECRTAGAGGSERQPHHGRVNARSTAAAIAAASRAAWRQRHDYVNFSPCESLAMAMV